MLRGVLALALRSRGRATVWGLREDGSSACARHMSGGGEADGAAGDAGEKKPEERSPGRAPSGRSERPQRGRRDDGPNEDFNPVPIQPILSSETKTLMYELHEKDKVENSEEALAARFGISDVRVRAILMLQKRYRERQQEGTVGSAGVEMEKIVERTSGTVKTGFSSSFYSPDREGFRGVQADAQERNIKARPRPLFDVVDMHKAKRIIARLDEKYSGTGSFNPKKVEHERLVAAAAAEVPVTPLAQAHGLPVTMSKRFKYVFADISKGVAGKVRPKCPRLSICAVCGSGFDVNVPFHASTRCVFVVPQDREVIVRDPDGTCRSANFEERFRVEQFVSPAKLPRT